MESAATGEPGFAKYLSRNRDRQARGRFHREVAAYETLTGLDGLPRLLDHNSDKFAPGTEQLWLVLERIDGVNLTTYINDNGPLDLPTALAFIDQLLTTLAACHDTGTIHRDIKPGNIMLRNADPALPVLVDFGLSFNAEIDDELTRTGEEVGNRFLRLPEQSFAPHTVVGDITQTAGVLLYALTGLEPRTLLDHNGMAPHQRPPERARLETVAQAGTQRQLLTVLDKAFTNAASRRFANANELQAALESVGAVEPPTGDSSLEALMSRLERESDSDAAQQVSTRYTTLHRVSARISDQIDALARTRGLIRHATGHSVEPEADPPRSQYTVAMTEPRSLPATPAENVTYIFELRGDELVLLVDGRAIWRGTDPDDPSLSNTVLHTALQRYFNAKDQT